MQSTGFFLSLLAAVSLLSFTTPQVSACTSCCVVRDGRILFGNNEDFTKPGYVWVVAGSEKRFGRINLGFADRFVQGSLNERGLAFDAMALPPVPWQADPNKESPSNLIEKIMNECETVEQALQYFEKFNCRHLGGGQFLFADATGDAAVVAWLPDSGISITRIRSDHLLATNTRLEASGYRCQRFVKAEQVLGSLENVETESVAAILNAVHQRGPGGFTSYSNIFDLKNRTIHLYNLANFDEPVVLDLREELARGTTESRPLAGLFRSSPTLDSIRAGEQRTHWETRVPLSNEALDKLVGTYSPEQDPSVKIEVTRGDGVLLVESPGQSVATLMPESATSFRIAPDRGQVTFVFGAPSDASPTGLILHKGRDLRAIRVSK